MFELFKEFLAPYGFSDEKIRKIAAEVSAVFFLAMIGASSKKLSEREMKEVKGMSESGKVQEVNELLKGKYSPEEWDEISEATMKKVVENWMENVLPANI